MKSRGKPQQFQREFTTIPIPEAIWIDGWIEPERFPWCSEEYEAEGWKVVALEGEWLLISQENVSGVQVELRHNVVTGQTILVNPEQNWCYLYNGELSREEGPIKTSDSFDFSFQGDVHKYQWDEPFYLFDGQAIPELPESSWDQLWSDYCRASESDAATTTLRYLDTTGTKAVVTIQRGQVQCRIVRNGVQEEISACQFLSLFC